MDGRLGVRRGWLVLTSRYLTWLPDPKTSNAARALSIPTLELQRAESTLSPANEIQIQRAGMPLRLIPSLGEPFVHAFWAAVEQCRSVILQPSAPTDDGFNRRDTYRVWIPRKRSRTVVVEYRAEDGNICGIDGRLVDLSLGVVLRLPGPYLLSAKRANGSAVALVHEGLSFVPAFLTEHGVFLQAKTSEKRGECRQLLDSYRCQVESEAQGREATLLHTAEVAIAKKETERLVAVVGQAQASAIEDKRLAAQAEATLRATETARQVAELQAKEAQAATGLAQRELLARRNEVEALQEEKQHLMRQAQTHLAEKGAQ